MELWIACVQSLEESNKIPMLQVNRYILTAVLFMDANGGIFQVAIFRIFMLHGRKQLD